MRRLLPATAGMFIALNRTARTRLIPTARNDR
jgi:hypothetical protein